MIDVIQDDRPPLGGDAARETPADRDPDALADFLLQAAGRGGDQLTARVVQQQHRGGIGIQDLLHPAQQRGEKFIGAQMGQRRIGNRPDVPQPVLRIRRRGQRHCHHERLRRHDLEVSGPTSENRREPARTGRRPSPCTVQAATEQFHDPEYARNDLDRTQRRQLSTSR